MRKLVVVAVVGGALASIGCSGSESTSSSQQGPSGGTGGVSAAGSGGSLAKGGSGSSGASGASVGGNGGSAGSGGSSGAAGSSASSGSSGAAGTGGGAPAGPCAVGPKKMIWSPLPDSPFAGDLRGGVLDAKVHLVSQTHHLVLDVASKAWSEQAAIPAIAEAAVVHQGTLYAFTAFGKIYAWSTPDAWTEVGKTATPKAARALSTTAGIVRVGGVPTDKKVDRFDPSTGTTDALPDVPLSEIDGAAIANGRLYVFGDNDLEKSRVVELALDSPTAAWKELAPLAPRRPAPGTVDFSGAIWRIGGVSGQAPVDDGWIFDPIGNVWCEGPTLPAPRAYPSAFDVAGALVVVGGGYGTSSWKEAWLGTVSP